jgi:DNA (cytosine-5)-methyltransferase 1
MTYAKQIIRESMPGLSDLLWKDDIMFLIVDLFCGAGGTTTGFERAMLPSLGVDKNGRLVRICKTVACVNHDKWAIASHAANHPDVLHFTEDITTLNLAALLAHVERMRAMYPNAKLILWASLECTNFSNAKGGQSRDADSRSLADHMPRYIDALQPDYFMVENVREFMSWGPMIPSVNLSHKFEGHKAPICKLVFDKDEKRFTPHWVPESRTKGKDFQRWIRQIQSAGFSYEHKLLNAADFGAYTSRLRYFAIFAKSGMPTVWPEPTHAKKSGKVTKQSAMFGHLKPWMAVREVLDFSDEGYSIFDRKNNLSLPKRNRTNLKEKTFQRIYAGCIKHIAKGETAFLSKYYSGDPDTKNIRTDGPAGTMTTTDSHALVQPAFLVKYNGNDQETGINNGASINEPCLAVTTQSRLYLAQAEMLPGRGTFIVQRQNDVAGRKPDGRVVSVDGPARTLTTTGGNQEVVQPTFLANYYSSGGQTASVDTACPSLTTKDRVSVIQAESFLDQQYGNSQPSSVDGPAATLTPTPKLNVVQTHFLSNYYSTGGQDQSIEEPAGSIMTIPKQSIVCAEGFLSNPAWGGNAGALDQPSPTVVARQDKAPLSFVKCEPFLMTNQHKNSGRSLDEPSPTLLTGNHHYILNAQFNHTLRSVDEAHPTITADRHYSYLVVTEKGELAIQIFETDSPTVVKLKQFMAYYGIIDIKMRMLNIPELKRIQGFGDQYVLLGTMTDQKKFIGNSVEPRIPRAMAQALGSAFRSIRL